MDSIVTSGPRIISWIKRGDINTLHYIKRGDSLIKEYSNLEQRMTEIEANTLLYIWLFTSISKY